jgi:predicted O-methyltransferase YrrM
MILMPDDCLSSLLNDEARYLQIEEVLPAEGSAWPISRELARFLARVVVTMKPTSVLEFGAGQSSLIFACSLSLAGGGRLTSVDHLIEYCSEAWEKLKATESIDASLVISRLRPILMREGLLYGYSDAAPTIAARGPYDLVFIDGPPSRYGRDAPLHIAYPYLNTGALVVLDDAVRPEEAMTVDRWLRRYPGLELVCFDLKFGRGVAVLRHNGDKNVRLSPRSIASATSICVTRMAKDVFRSLIKIEACL